MATESRWRRDPTLRPIRWPGPATRRITLRAVAVAVLLALAAALLYPGTPGNCPAVNRDDRAHAGVASGSPGGASPGTGVSPGVVGVPVRPAAGGPAGGGPVGSAVGPTTAGGSPSTARRVALPAGAVGVPIRLAESAALSVVAPGARVDLLLLASGQPTRTPTLVASGALVVDVIRPGGDDAGVLYLALPPGLAARAAAAGADGRFAVLVHP